MAKIKGENVTFRIDDDLAAELDNACARLGALRSEVVRISMRKYLGTITEPEVVVEQKRRKPPPGRKSNPAMRARELLEKAMLDGAGYVD